MNDCWSPWDEKWMNGMNPSVWITLFWDTGYHDPSQWLEVEEA